MKARWPVLVVLLALVAARARADQPQAQPTDEIEAPFALFVNHVEKGDIIIVLRGDDVFAARADLAAAGLQVEGGEEAMIAGRKLLRLGSLAPAVGYELDEEAIALRITAAPELLPHTRIDLADRPPDLVYTKDTSAFFNYAPRASDRGTLDLYQETGLSIDGNLLFSSAYFANYREPVRGLTHLIVDDRPALVRYTVGDALVNSGALGSGGFVGGVTISRNYALDPYMIRLPRLGLQGSTPTPATLEVLVNGNRVHREEIAPGTFSIENLQVGGGSGVATYVIRDVFGNEQYVATPFYASANALRPGLDEFTYSVGMLRSGVGAESWGYDRPVVFAQHRFGMSRMLTLGGRAEAISERISAGPSFTLLSDIGQFDLDLAASYDTGSDAGAAAQVAYTYSSRLMGFGLLARAQSHRYSTVGLAPEEDRAVADASVSLSVPIGSLLTVAYRTQVAGMRDGGVLASIGGQTSMNIVDGLAWLTFASRTKREGEPVYWEVATALSYSFERFYSAQASATTSSRGEALRLNLQRTPRETIGLAYGVSADIAERLDARARVQYQAAFGRYAADYWASERGHEAMTVEAAGSLVVVPGAGVYPSLPVQSSFGLVRLPGLAGVRAYGNHQEIGRTDERGNLVIPNLLQYYGNLLSIAPEDVPMEYELERTEVVLAPPPRGVALAVFPVRIPHFYRGRVVVDRGGRRVIPKHGQIRVEPEDGEAALSPLGEEGEFELSELDPGQHRALIEWVDGTCTFELELPRSGETVIELGEVTCRQSAPAPEQR